MDLEKNQTTRFVPDDEIPYIQLPPSPASILYHPLEKPSSRTSMWIKILAAIGLFLLCERTLFTYNFLFSPRPLNKAIIAASTSSEDTSWLKKYFGAEWDINIYVVDEKDAELTVYKNTGNEANVYLTYIINHYWSLPDYMVFSHSGRYQWHNDDPMYDGVEPIKNLRLDYVKKEGYTNLRCEWNLGCPTAVQPNSTKESDDPFNFDRSFALVFRELFPDQVEVPSEIGHQCCGQFAVTREQVLKRPPADYERLRQWIWSKKNIPDFQAGRIIEHIWHMVFQKPAVHCPSAPECYCKQYGLCDLRCPQAPESCLGRYKMPFFWVTMNPDWPEKGQGEKGFPRDGWWKEYYPIDLYNGFRLRPGKPLPNDAYRATNIAMDATSTAEKLEIERPLEEIIEDIDAEEGLYGEVEGVRSQEEADGEENEE